MKSQIGFLMEEEIKLNKGEVLSCELVKQAYLKEYSQRFEQYLKARERLLTIKASSHN